MQDKNNSKAVACVIVDISHEKVDRGFEYRVPEEMQERIAIGMEVKVPFGKGNHLRKAYVVDLQQNARYPYELKNVQEINEKAVSMESKILQLAYWMKNRYGSTLINCLKTVLPVKKKIKESTYKMVVLAAEDTALEEEIKKCNPQRNGGRIKLLRELQKTPSLPYSLVTGKLGISPSSIATLEKHGMLRIETEKQMRGPKVRTRGDGVRHILSQEQQTVIEGIGQDIAASRFSVSLLHGITGSGKTEVYMELIAKTIARGRQAIVLIPEIALTFQTLMRFYERFGDKVAVMHSKLSDGERFDQYERAKSGELQIIIGPRSALFTPFPDLGIIVIDEEHESSYKSEKMPKYHARDVAEYLAKRENAVLVLGSATPSLESYYKARNGEYFLYEMTQRNGGAMLPAVYGVDMRRELKEGNRSYFSNKLRECLTECLAHGQQAMLFINRRGYAGFVSCRSCGYVAKCPHCDVSLSQHRGSNGKQDTLVCHYCGYEIPVPDKCPDCGSPYIAGFRAGTEKIEMELKKLYPFIRTLRMDADSTKRKEDYEKILASFSNREADVLIGTQMIVKGHDFPNVTLVGIIAADLSLFSADYQSAERCFQLVVQACGRAGRGKQKGNVVVQSYQPEHYSLKHAMAQDYKGFYEEEIVYRLLGGYPPVCNMLAVQLFAAQKQRGEALIKELAELVKGDYTIIGPGPAVISKMKDIYRMVFYVKDASYDRLITVKDRLEQQAEEMLTNQEVLQFDFNPKGMF
ncbi:MAG: primosomal protein N' [Lachnospiraceae bacterium]